MSTQRNLFVTDILSLLMANYASWFCFPEADIIHNSILGIIGGQGLCTVMARKPVIFQIRGDVCVHNSLSLDNFWPRC